MVLGPVKFDASGDPGAGKPHKGRLDDMVVIDEIIAVCLVVSPLDASPKLRQHHDLQILVFQKDRPVHVVRLLVADLFCHRVGIDFSAASLVLSRQP